MKETKILIEHKTKLQNTESFIKNYQNKLNKYINEGFEIKASNMCADGNFAYIYTLLEK